MCADMKLSLAVRDHRLQGITTWRPMCPTEVMLPEEMHDEQS
jgi:hypothetical protein